MRWILALVVLSSCSTLRTGWVQVDFLTEPTDVMVCSFSVKPDSDGEMEITGKCADWSDVNEGLGALGLEQKIKRIHQPK